MLYNYIIKLVIISALLASNSFVLTAQQPNTWRQRADFPGGATNGVFSFGTDTRGFLGGGLYNSQMWEYSYTTNTWSQKASYPGIESYWSACFSVGDKGYVGLGGITSNSNEFFEYNMQTNVWTAKATFPGGARSRTSHFAIDGKGYVALGSSTFYSGSGNFNDLWMYDPVANSWSRKADFPATARQFTQSFVIDNKAYVGGGSPYDGSNVAYNAFFAYDPLTNSWSSSIAPLPINLYAGSSFTLGNKGYVGIGLQYTNQAFKTQALYSYDPTNNTWTQKANFPGAARNSATGFTIGPRAYLGTGYSVSLHNDFYEYMGDGIITGNVAPIICKGKSFLLSYNCSNPFFNSGNNFVAQLSDANGSFANPITIGSVALNVSGNINVTIPNTVPNGQNYKVRVIGTQPYTEGLDNGTNIEIRGAVTHTLNTVLCYGQTINFGGTIYNTSQNGIVKTFTGSNTCDSVVTMNLTILPQNTHSINPSICQGQTFNFGGTNYTTSQSNVVKTFTNTRGCDSVVTMNLTVNPTYANTINPVICQGLSYNFGGTLYTTSQNGVVRTFTSMNGCDSVVTMNLTVHPKISRTITQSICQNTLPITWNNQTVNTVGSHTLVFTTPSTVTGCDSTTTLLLTVMPAPVVRLGNDTSICANVVYALNGTTSGGVAYLWSNNVTTPILNITSPGTYRLSVTDANGCIGRDTIIVNHLVVPTVNLGPDLTTCRDTGWSTTLNAGNAGAQFLWDNNTVASTRTVTQNGTYSVRVTNAMGCANRDTIVVAHRINPILSLPVDTYFCEGNSVVLDATLPNIAAYSWNTGASTPSIIANAPRVYKVNVTAVNGCTAADSTHVIVKPNPVVDLGPNYTKCIDEGAVEFLNARNPGADYLWDNQYNGQVRVIDQSGTYAVKVTNKWGCVSSDTIHVTLKHNPKVNLGQDTTVCIGASVTLNAGNNGLQYIWNTGATSSSITVNRDGVYKVVVTASNGCVVTDSINIHQQGYAPKHDGIWVTNKGPKTFKFRLLNPTYINSYIWDFGDGSPLSFASEPEHTFPATGNYIVRLHSLSSCGGAHDTTTVHILSTTDIADLANTDANVLVYPVPADKYLKIETKNDIVITHIDLINQWGQTIIQEQLNSTAHLAELDIAAIVAGNYYLKIVTNKGTLYRKITIIK